MLANSAFPGFEMMAVALPFANGVLSVSMVKLELYRNHQKRFIRGARREVQETSKNGKQQELPIPFGA